MTRGFEEEDDEELDEDAEEDEATKADFFGKANQLLSNLANVARPVSDLAKTLMHKPAPPANDAGLRNVASGEPVVEETEDDASEAPSHLVMSHLLLISHELGAEDGSIFRRLLVRLPADQRAQMIAQLSELSIEDAVAVAGQQVERCRARQKAHTRRAAEAPGRTADAPSMAADEGDHDEDMEPMAPDDAAEEDDQNLGGMEDVVVAVVPAQPAPSPPPLRAEKIEPRAITPEVMEHMKRIASHLTILEAMQIKGLIDSVPVIERNAWIERLMAATPAQGAAMARAELARRTA